MCIVDLINALRNSIVSQRKITNGIFAVYLAAILLISKQRGSSTFI